MAQKQALIIFMNFCKCREINGIKFWACPLKATTIGHELRAGGAITNGEPDVYSSQRGAFGEQHRSLPCMGRESLSVGGRATQQLPLLAWRVVAAYLERGWFAACREELSR